MKRGWIKYLLYSIALIVIGGILLFFINLGYSYSWTGFAEFTPTNPDTVPSKTLWDWMELLIVPLVLAGGAFYLNRSERAVERQTVEDRIKEDRKLAEDRAKLERDLATDRQQEAALQTYFDRMSELLLKEKLRTTENVEVRNVARTRTISIIRGLDTKRINLILQFLSEAELITNEKSILKGAKLYDANLKGADLQGANLNDADLKGADLEGAVLQGANLERANLEGANLQGIVLVKANLQSAILIKTNLYTADLQGANLQGAVLVGAYLQDANLWLANLQGANLQGAVLQIANLEGANLEGAYLERADLERANLEYADLERAVLERANLEHADLEGANLKDAYLERANLEGAYLFDADNITEEQLASVKSLKGATMPDGTKHE